jgi:fibronectin-binding autotransporter adhesin
MAHTGSLGGSLRVNANGRLEGAGAVGATTINAGGTIAPNDGAQLTINGNLALKSGALFAYDLDDASASKKSAAIQVNGDLALNGATLNIVNGPAAPSIGFHRLIGYTGALSPPSGGMTVGTTPITSPLAYNYSIDTSVAHAVDLLVQPDGLNVLQRWGGGTNGVGMGSGVWNGAHQNWRDPLGGSLPTQWGSGYGIFRGPGGTVTIEGQQSAVGLQFAGGAYTLEPGAGGSLRLHKLENDPLFPGLHIPVPEIRVLANETATISAPIEGIDGLEKTGDGKLILSGINTYQGTTIVSGGTLQISSNDNLGNASNALVLDNATLRTTAAPGDPVDSSRSITLRGNATIEVATGSEFFLQSGSVGGDGALIKRGDGNLILTGANSWSGGTLITAGQLTAQSSLPNMTDYALTGGLLNLVGVSLTMRSLTGTGGAIAMWGGNLTVNQSIDTAFAGSITGLSSDHFNKAGTGTLLLTGINTYLGETRITGGTLAIVAANNLGIGSVSSTIMINDATLATLGDMTLNRWFSLQGIATINTFTGTTLTLSSDVSGTPGGSLLKTGGGKLVLSGNGTYGGGTTVAAGTLQIGDGGTSGSIVGNVTNNSIFAFNRSDTYGFAGIISGAGALLQAGSGTTLLTGANTYTGNTFVEGGTLQIGNGGTSGSIMGGVLNNGVLAFNRSDAYTFAGLIAGTGSLTQAGSGTTILTTNNTYQGGTTINAGTLQLGNGGAAGWITGNVTNNGTLAFNRSDVAIFGGAVTGAGSLRQIGPGATVLTANNNYGGGTTISGGALVLGNGGTSGAIIGDVTNNSILAFNRSNISVFGGMISGAGAVQQLGAGTTVLTGTNTYGGGTLIAFGTLQLGNGGAAGSITGDVLNNGTLAFNRSDTVTFAGDVWGYGSLAQIGAGTTILTGQNVYGRGATISAGTLQLGDGGTSGSLSGDVVNNSRLVVNNARMVILDGAISGSGSLSQVGSGMTVLGGANTYSGGTSITAGTLVVGRGESGQIVGDVANQGTLAFGRADTSTFGGVISGTGLLAQSGSGTTILSGNSTFTGATDVFAGRLSVNGSIASSSQVTVHTDGTLGGNGIVGLTQISGGALSPGNSIGLLTVQGNLTFSAASSYMVEVSGADADRVNVTGIANLGGATVRATYDPGSYVMRRYTILNAAGGLGGSSFHSEVNTDLPAHFAPSLTYDANNVYLDMAMSVAGLTVNQRDVSTTLVDYFYRNGQIPVAFGRLDPAGLTQASGELATGVQQTTIDAMTMFMGTMTDPFMAGRAGMGMSGNAAAMAYASTVDDSGRVARGAFAAMPIKAPTRASFDQRWSVWAAGFGGTRTTDGDGVVVGSHTIANRIYGAAVGADYRASPDTLLGFAMAGGGTTFNMASGLGAGRSDLFQAGAFVRHAIGNAYLSGALAYGWQDVTTDRTLTLFGVDRLRANFQVSAFSGRLEGGYRFATPWMGITPYVAGQFVAYALPAYLEQAIAGKGTFALSYASKSETAARSELGFRADRSLVVGDAILTLRGRAAWAHNFNTERNVGVPDAARNRICRLRCFAGA